MIVKPAHTLVALACALAAMGLLLAALGIYRLSHFNRHLPDA